MPIDRDVATPDAVIGMLWGLYCLKSKMLPVTRATDPGSDPPDNRVFRADVQVPVRTRIDQVFGRKYLCLHAILLKLYNKRNKYSVRAAISRHLIGRTGGPGCGRPPSGPTAL